MRIAPFCGSALLLAALCVGGPRAACADGASVVVFDAADPAAVAPRGEGVTSALATVGGRTAAKLDVAAGLAWARIFFQKSVPEDIRGFAVLELDLHGGEASAEIQLRLSDAAQRTAGLKIDAPKAGWETQRVKLGDFNPDAGFDPEQVASLSLLWSRPTAKSVGLARVVFVPGAGGWRHTPEEQAKRVFGDKLAKQVRFEASEHFDVFSDSPKALKELGPVLEADLFKIRSALGASKEQLAEFRLPVYAFKSPGDYGEYCTRTFGWTDEQARRRPATGTSWALILAYRDGPMPDRTHRLARALFQHIYGPGGGSWLQDGAGEYCVRALDGRTVTKEFAPRLRAGAPWPLPDLLRAEPLYAPGTNTQATYDYRPIFLYAASVFEYLLKVPPGAASAGPSGAGERISARFKALAAVRTSGKERLSALEGALGQPLAEFEAAWKAWVAADGSR